MTSSRYKDAPVAKAKERFGLLLADLESLLDLKEGSAEDIVGDQLQGLPPFFRQKSKSVYIESR
jgi:hypothetical protein